MIKFFKGLLKSNGSQRPAKEAAVKEEQAVEYNGFSISPCPRNVGGGWSTEAVIRKQIDGEVKQHKFIRADTSASKEAAISLIISKAKTLIDQQGDGILS